MALSKHFSPRKLAGNYSKYSLLTYALSGNSLPPQRNADWNASQQAITARLTEQGVAYFSCENTPNKRLGYILTRVTHHRLRDPAQKHLLWPQEQQRRHGIGCFTCADMAQGQRLEEMKCGKNKWFSHRTDNQFCSFRDRTHLQRKMTPFPHASVLIFLMCAAALNYFNIKQKKF